VHTAMTMPPKKLLSCSPSTFSCKSEGCVSVLTEQRQWAATTKTDLEQQSNKKKEEQVQLRSLTDEIEPPLRVRRHDQRGN
jgi:hypothetical protein